MKPILFCDIDGVVNVPKKSHEDLVEIPFTSIPGLPRFFNYKTFRHRPQVADFLREVNAELVWLTAWQKFAPPSLDVLFGRESAGFLPWEHSVIQWFTDKQHYQKSVALNKWVEDNPDKPFIWIDDYATQFAPQYAFSKRKDVLIIQPDGKQGMTDEHITQMHEFLESF